jgi:RNA-binding protein
MKFLGTISHLSNSGKLIARSSNTPSSGAFVFNKNKKKIGKIQSVFGPTKNPYIAINLFKSINIESFRNSQADDLYMSLNHNKKRRERKTRKIK